MKSINEILTITPEGKLLLAAMAKITTESQTDKEPDEVLEQLNKLADEMFKDQEPAEKDPEIHKQHHILLAQILDQLFADYIYHNPDQDTYIGMPVSQLLTWAKEQKENPTPIKP